MRRKLPLILLSLVVVLSLAAGVLYFYLIDPLGRKRDTSERSINQPAGELLVTHSKPISRNVPLRLAVLNTLEVVRTKLSPTGPEASDSFILELTVKAASGREERELTIPILGSIEIQQGGVTADIEENKVSVSEVELEEGDVVNVALAYVPREEEWGRDEVASYCEGTGHEDCLRYVNVGFGEEPVEFDSYLEEVFNSDMKRIDYKVAFPNFITLR